MTLTPPRPREQSRAWRLARSRARDRSCDGLFIVGVLSTGIYCLPSCPARDPSPENVEFFEGEDEARAAGLRACKRCRPDDFYRGYDPDRELAESLARAARTQPEDIADARSLARSGGVGLTKLGALFREHFHTTPAAYLARARVARARELLATTGARVLDIGLDVGFESSSSFHENFRRWSGLAPRDYRRLLAEDEFRVELPAGYPWTRPLDYLTRDPESANERREGASVTKGIVLAGKPCTLELNFGAESVEVRVASRGRIERDQRRAAHVAAVRLLALEQDPAAFERRMLRTRGLGRLVRGRLGLRVPQAGDAFEGLAWSIVGQQVNLRFAYALRRRMVRLAGRKLAGGLYAHPTAREVARLDVASLRKAQYSERKAQYLIEAAGAIAAGKLPLTELGNVSAERARETLLAQRGLGPWSVHYLQMRAFGLADCVPLGDSGLTSGLQRFFELSERPGPQETLEQMSVFAPFRSFATFHLWNLDS